MKQFQHEFAVRTHGQKLHDITREVGALVSRSGIAAGLATVFCRHTSASLLINENADAGVRHDLETFLKRLVPDGDPHFVHRLEGPDDMSAHIKTALTAVSLGIPIADGKLVLGTWQGIFLFEHRIAPHERWIFVHLLGK